MNVVIIGSGIAGLTSALTAAEYGDEVVLISKEKSYLNSASTYAQGGIAYRGKDDSPELFLQDIITASGGMTYEKITHLFTREAPEVLRKILIEKNQIPFHCDDTDYIFTEEAIHSRKRILFSGDKTGEVIIKHLASSALKHPRIKILNSHLAVDLINIPHHSKNPLSIYEESRCVGIYVYDLQSKKVDKVFSDKIILATGGIGQLFLHSTNPKGSTGDGIAIAHRAGARIINMEFTQFHPTALAIKQAEGFLISETLRGEGAVLVNSQGHNFMKRYDHRGSLSPRDIVSRAIIQEQLRTGSDHMYLSLKKCRFDFPKRFPRIYTKCLECDLDVNSPTFKGIPITPAFHYSCGGIFTDEWGRTTIRNLFAVGEVACTGLHGANRLASTSLLEGLFFGYRAALYREKQKKTDFSFSKKDIKNWSSSHSSKTEVDPVIIKKDFLQLQTLMWNYVGIIRHTSHLAAALEELQFLRDRIEERYRKHQLSREIIELRNSVQTALVVTDSAIKNKKSIGCHYLIA